MLPHPADFAQALISPIYRYITIFYETLFIGSATQQKEVKLQENLILRF